MRILANKAIINDVATSIFVQLVIPASQTGRGILTDAYFLMGFYNNYCAPLNVSLVYTFCFLKTRVVWTLGRLDPAAGSGLKSLITRFQTVS